VRGHSARVEGGVRRADAATLTGLRSLDPRCPAPGPVPPL
jgi:hypothetical protein